MKARVPGKLILSGEHAIVHGRPALAMAVDRFATVEASPLDEAVLRIGEAVMPLANLPQHLAAVQARHQRFLQGQTPIREVAPGEGDLLFAAAALAGLRQGMFLRIASDIPLGAGLGSSAAVLIALFKALRPDWDDTLLFRHALACENFQHGRSSGLDVFACLHGGLVRGTPGKFETAGIPALPRFEVWDSGRPEASTGECVAAVGKHYPTTHPIWDDFARVTEATHAALVGPNAAQAWRAAVRENHRLLNRIGVVPPAVRAAITEIEAQGGAAKTCGAGSIRGDHAGMVLVLTVHHAPRLPSHWQHLKL
jgi:mevalonate kinase